MVWWKRFIDDIFAVLISDKINVDKIFEVSKNLNKAIKFTIEMPINIKLSFLDTLVSLDRNRNKSTMKL